MKKFLSMLLVAAMLVSSMVFVSTAAEPVDKALLFDDLTLGLDRTGVSGYVHNVSDYTKSPAGLTFMFDFMPIDYVKCSHAFTDPNASHHEALIITFGNAWFGYDFEEEHYYVAACQNWAPHGCNTVEGDDKQSYKLLGTYDRPIEYGTWDTVAIYVEDIYVQLWVNGEKVIDVEKGDMAHDYILFHSGHSRFALDNFVVLSSWYDISSNDLEAAKAEGYLYDINDFSAPEIVDAEITDEETGEVSIVKEKRYAGFDLGETLDEQNYATSAYTLVDKATLGGSLPDVDGAALSFTDAESGWGKEFTTDLVANGTAVDATGLKLVNDNLMEFVSVDNVADGCTVKVSGGSVDVKVPEGFKGTVATFKYKMLDKYVHTVEKEVEDADGNVTIETSTYDCGPGQQATYRYGIVSNGDVTIDAGSVYNVNFVLGDVNEDGKINLVDVVVIIQYRAKKDVYINLDAAEIVYDNIINAKDIVYLVQHLAKWPDRPL